MTQFETMYDLLSDDDHTALRRLLEDYRVPDVSAANVQDSCSSSAVDDGVHEAVEAAVDDRALQDLFLVCRMNAVTSSSRRVSSVFCKNYQPKVSATFNSCQLRPMWWKYIRLYGSI